MTVLRSLQIYCDGQRHGNPCKQNLVGDHEMETPTALRLAKESGWSRKDQSDFCPRCTARISRTAKACSSDEGNAAPSPSPAPSEKSKP